MSEKLFYKTSELVDTWVDLTLRDKEGSYLTGIEEFDKEFDYSLRGKFIALIGKGGSGKSMFGLQVSTGNSVGKDDNDKSCGIFMNGEMSNNNLLDRVFDFQFGEIHQEKKRASKHFKDSLTEGNANSYKKQLKDQLNDFYKDSLLITNSSDLIEIGKGIRELQNKKKNIVGLVIDSSSMMDSKGDSKESAEYYSKGFKKIANTYNICVLVIYHTPKSVPSDKRDLSEESKDSVTVFNNADAMISFSSILDEDGRKINDLKYLQLFAKRITGGYVDKVCRVNTSHLVLEPTNIPPESFPEREVKGF